MSKDEQCGMNSIDWGKEYLYHYTSFEAAAKILASGKLIFSDVKRLNDINESCGPTIIYAGCSGKEIIECENILMNYKQISLTMDVEGRRGFDIPAMWGHYASRGNGACLVFDNASILIDIQSESRLYSNQVSYSALEIPNEITYDKQFKESFVQFINQSKDKLFFRKTDDWSYEQEYRIITINDEIKALDISKHVVSVILYNRNHEDFLNSVEYVSLSKICPEIRFYRYAPGFIGGQGNLYGLDNNSIKPPIVLNYSITKGAAEENQ